jgi:hypothetical protein
MITIFDKETGKKTWCLGSWYEKGIYIFGWVYFVIFIVAFLIGFVAGLLGL